MKRVRKIIAILLTVLTLMSIISAATPVLAVEVTKITETEVSEENSETAETEGNEGEEETTVSDETEILHEMVEWRTESAKYFRNSDGSYTAAQYAYPIHYEENGEWKEIDNTLTEKTVSGTDKEFVAENTNTPAIFPEELNQDENNEISITAGNHTIRFSPKKNQKGFKVSDGEIKDREDLDSVKIVESAQEKQEAFTFKETKKAEKEDRKESSKKEKNRKNKFKVENKSGAIVYENVFENVDFEYELNNSKLKESIVLNEKQTNYVFSFNMDLDGLYPVICEDGAINLCSDKAGKNPVSKIEAPYMVDSNGEYSDSVTMSIEENGKEYILTVTADENWLNDNERAYPVVIDPTIDLNISRLNVIDNYIDNSTLEASESHPYAYHIYAGHSSLGKTRAYVKFNLPDLPDDNCIITNAFIVYYQTSVDKGSSDGYLTIHEVTDNWNNTDASLLPTWNKQPKFDDKVLDYAKIEYNEGNEARVYQFDITKTVKEWYETDKLKTNNGFLLKSLDESKINRVQLYSAENSAYDAYPAIYVHFRNNKGLESYWDYSSFGVGVAGTAHINDYSGNLVYELPLTSSSGEIMPISIVAYYNNYCAGQLMNNTKLQNIRTSIGRGFRLNYQQTVLPSSEYIESEKFNKEYPYVYTDADGTEHYIQKVIENEGKDDEKTVYKDEDGLGLTLTTGKDDNDKTYYKIEDKAHNTYYFNFRGNLSRIKDTNGNEMQIIYKAADSANNLLDRTRIDKIIDGAGHTYTFTYNDNKDLDYVRAIEDDAGRVIDFDISEGLLTDVEFPGENYAHFDYEISENDSSEKRINAVYSNGIYELNFDYTSLKTGRRVKTVKEYSETGSKGQVITFDRSKYNTTIMRSCGLDGIHYIDNASNGKDDIITTIQYDNMGRAISQQMKFGSGDEISAGSCAYTTSDSDETASGFKNKVSGSGATGKYVENLLYDGNTEDEDEFWAYDTAGSVDAVRGISTASKYIGTSSLKLTINEVTGANGRCYYRQNFTSNVKPDTAYTLSAYVKVGDLVAYSKGDLKGAFIQIIGYDEDGNAIDSVNSRSQIITERSDLDVNNGWRRLSCTVETNSDTKSLRCYLFLRNAEGSVCFDGIQLEKGDTANDYNMLQNSHFTELKSDSEPKFWTATGQMEFSTGSTITNGVKTTSGTTGSDTKAMIITGSPDVEKGVAQTVEVEGNSDDTYILSGWAKGFPVNSSFHTETTDDKGTETTKDDVIEETALFEIAVKVKYSVSNSSEPVEEFKTPASFNTTITGWQCASVPISLKYSKAKEGVTYTPQSITIIPRYNNQANYVYFDKIMLVKDAASSYTYDDEGNILTASSNSEQESTMKYDKNNNLTSYKDTAGNTTKLTYDDNNNLQTQKSAKGVKTEYTYNDEGLLRTTEVHNNWLSIDSKDKDYVAPTAAIKTSQKYYTDVSDTDINEGAFIFATYDENQNRTSFTYDYETGNTLTVTNAKDVVKTNTYCHDNTKPYTTTINNTKVKYVYDIAGRLSEIKFGKYANGKFDSNEYEEYFFEYDKFGNVEQTFVGSYPLSTNTYKPNNGPLETTEYGNGDSRRYSYNNFGQKIVDYVTDGNTEKKSYSWSYNDSGINIRHTDYINGLQYLFDYDSLGRLSKVETVDKDTKAFIGLTEYGYDVRNNLTNLVTNFGGNYQEQQYFYSSVSESSNSADYAKDNLPTMYKLYDDRYAVYSYDSLNRLTQRKFNLKNNDDLYYNYIYKSSDRNAEGESFYRTNQVSKEFIGNDVYIYGYDVLGNITSIKTAERSEKNTNSTSFTNQKSYVSYKYDDLGQLTEEKFLGDKTKTTWTYDELGNITAKNEYITEVTTDPETNKTTEKEIISKTVTYNYDKDENTGWNNILISVDLDDSDIITDNEKIEYDAIGNPTKYFGATLTWSGRQLTKYTKDNTTITYKYDADGLRTYKKVGSLTSKYFYANGNLHYEERSNGTKLYFFYDSNGYLSGIDYNGTTYYPATNRRGDVVAIYKNTGECIAKYEYDAWGNVLSVIDCDYYDEETKKTIEKDITNDTTSTDIAMVNPIRYRGYYYDTETKLYYLQSRYYNPEVGRFLNSDSISDNGAGVLGYNTFIYCANNPVNALDPSGHSIIGAILLGAAIGAVVNGAINLASQLKRNNGDWKAINKKELGIATAIGGVSGALSGALGFGVGELAKTAVTKTVATIIGEGLINTTVGNIQAMATGEERTLADNISDFAIGSFVAGLGSAIPVFSNNHVFNNATKSEKRALLGNVFTNREIRNGVTDTAIYEDFLLYGSDELTECFGYAVTLFEEYADE